MSSKTRGRPVTAGSVTLAAPKGASQITFQGRIGRTGKLKPGTYTVTFTATDFAGKRSAPQALRFTIVR